MSGKTSRAVRKPATSASTPTSGGDTTNAIRMHQLTHVTPVPGLRPGARSAAA